MVGVFSTTAGDGAPSLPGTTGWSRISRSGTSGERVIAAWSCISGSIGQVSNSVPGNSDSPCSSDVFIRMKRTKSTLPASMEMLGLRRRARSEALPRGCEHANVPWPPTRIGG
ncbi:Hypothetical protein PHPALM_5611 [Phytophthora palmivora]|uniref:Uncharacterized protein n=1 Tax=Phytophthora palmivora TaxID=4796 RepID=A0A2P4YGX7_9STRA|nr:Hypothetical protein PHPALM_5611 [Phytophthora palmivora]